MKEMVYNIEMVEDFILLDSGVIADIPYLILSTGINICAYIGVPRSNPLAGLAGDSLPLHCHGGITYSGYGDGTVRPLGIYWFGWDYGHYGDFMGIGGGKRWTTQEVLKEVEQVICDFKEILSFLEEVLKVNSIVKLKKWVKGKKE